MKRKDWPDVLLLAYCGSLLFFAVVSAVMAYLSLHSTLDWHVITYAAAIFGIAQAVTTLTVPLAVSRTPMKTAAFIIAAIAMIITIATFVQRITNAANIAL